MAQGRTKIWPLLLHLREANSASWCGPKDFRCFCHSIEAMPFERVSFHIYEIYTISNQVSNHVSNHLLLLEWYITSEFEGYKRPILTSSAWCLNTLRSRQNGRHNADDIFKCIFLNENAQISLKISLKFVPKFRVNNIPALAQIMVLRRPGNKPLSEPMMVSLLTHLCVTRP